MLLLLCASRNVRPCLIFHSVCGLAASDGKRRRCEPAWTLAQCSEFDSHWLCCGHDRVCWIESPRVLWSGLDGSHKARLSVALENRSPAVANNKRALRHCAECGAAEEAAASGALLSARGDYQHTPMPSKTLSVWLEQKDEIIWWRPPIMSGPLFIITALVDSTALCFIKKAI